MSDFTNLLICKGADGVACVAQCSTWRAEVGALAVVDGQLLEVCDVICLEKDEDEYRFISRLHDIKEATAIYTKTWEKEVAEDGGTA